MAAPPSPSADGGGPGCVNELAKLEGGIVLSPRAMARMSLSLPKTGSSWLGYLGSRRRFLIKDELPIGLRFLPQRREA